MLGKPNVILPSALSQPKSLKSVWRLVKCPDCNDIINIPYDNTASEATCCDGHTFALVGNAATAQEVLNGAAKP